MIDLRVKDSGMDLSSEILLIVVRRRKKAFTFYRIEIEEMSERYITPCFVSGLHAYDGEINLEYEKKMISNEFAIKLLLDYVEKDGEKVVKKELLVALKGELYFVKFIINPKEDDVVPGVVLAILASVDDSDLPQLDVTDVPMFTCNMEKSSRDKKRPCGNYKMSNSDEGLSLTVKKPLTQEESSENLNPIPSDSEAYSQTNVDVLFENTTPLNALNEHYEIVVNSDDDNSSSDDDSPYGEDIEYVDASPPDVEIVSFRGC
ncbi:hypothetical protein Tco_0492757 [Tanacetum coccineum]